MSTHDRWPRILGGSRQLFLKQLALALFISTNVVVISMLSTWLVAPPSMDELIQISVTAQGFSVFKEKGRASSGVEYARIYVKEYANDFVIQADLYEYCAGCLDQLRLDIQKLKSNPLRKRAWAEIVRDDLGIESDEAHGEGENEGAVTQPITLLLTVPIAALEKNDTLWQPVDSHEITVFGLAHAGRILIDPDEALILLRQQDRELIRSSLLWMLLAIPLFFIVVRLRSLYYGRPR